MKDLETLYKRMDLETLYRQYQPMALEILREYASSRSRLEADAWVAKTYPERLTEFRIAESLFTQVLSQRKERRLMRMAEEKGPASKVFLEFMSCRLTEDDLYGVPAYPRDESQAIPELEALIQQWHPIALEFEQVLGHSKKDPDPDVWMAKTHPELMAGYQKANDLFYKIVEERKASRPKQEESS